MMNQMSDMVVLGLEDKSLADYFTGKQVGDTVKVTITATIDEMPEGQAVLSITDAEVAAYKDPKKADESSPAVKLFKNAAPAAEEEEEGEEAV